ncbi:hypothetical protein Acr_28g0011980 [Actinidia rufa]|uniref:ATP synthase subunit d, mitochondrial n=1 Tax=Actinidia rufa TaxID=165716 RepID=A0A7J0HBM2_9ERIC|nr:hypothetical protein Acr_28g0011980 [Actinidia rufa]
MSATGKKVVDVAFKAGKSIDWEGMAKLMVSDEARKEFATLRPYFRRGQHCSSDQVQPGDLSNTRI